MSPNPFLKTPDDEQSMFDQLRAQDQRRLTWQRQATPQIAAAIGQFHVLAPHAGPGVALGVGLGNIPPANAAKVANDAAGNGVSAAPQQQPDRSNPNFQSNRQIAQIPGLAPEQQAAAARGVDVPGMSPDQLQQEQKILGVTPDMLAPKSKGITDFDWSNPFEGFDVLGEGVKDITRTALSVAQSGLEAVQNVAVNRPPMSADVTYMAGRAAGGQALAGETPDQAKARLGAQLTRVTSGGVPGVVTQPIEATTGYQSIVKGLSTGQGFLPNPSAPAGQYQAQAARNLRGVNSAGQAWTLGRQVAATVTQPGTTPYKILSGLTDAAVAWYADPALVAGKALSETRAANKIITPAAEFVGEGTERAAAGAERGSISGGVRQAVARTLSSTDFGKAMVSDLVNAKSPEAAAAIVGRDLGADTLSRLASADTPTRVAATLTNAAVTEKDWQWGQELLSHVDDSERTLARPGDRFFNPEEPKTISTWDEITQQAAKDKAGVLLQAERPAVGKWTADGWLNSNTGQYVLQKLAGDSDALSIHNALGRAAPVDVVNALTKARTPEEAANILRPVLGIEIKSLNDIRPASTFYNASTAIKRQLPLFDDGGNLISRQFAQIPSRVLKIGRDATPRDLTAAVNDADSWMRLLEVPYEDRTKTVSNFIDNLANGRRFDASSDLMTAMRKGMEAQGVDPDKAKQLTRMFDDYDKGLYGVDQYGKPTTFDLMHTADGPVNTSLAGPGLLSERMGSNVEMPDPRVVKRLTSMFGRAISTNEGQDLKLPLAYAERITNVWKRFAILRVATAVRVMGDEQARLAATDMPSMFNHPLHWIMASAGTREGLTAFGEHFDDAAALGHMDEYRKALGKSFFGALNEPDTLHAATYANGNWRSVSKFDEPSRWREGMVDEIRQLAADPVSRRVASGQTTDQILDWLKSDEGAKTRAAYTDLFRGPADDGVLRDYIDNYTRARIDTKVGDNQALRGVIANNRLPDSGEALYEAPVANRDLSFVKAGNPGGSEFGGTNRWLGATVKDSEGQIGVVTRDLGDGRSSVAYGAQGAFEKGDASDPLKAMIADWQAADNSPESVKWAERVKLPRSKVDMSQRLDRVTQAAVSALFDKPVSVLTRSPAFREAYYGELARLADRLTPDEANKLIKNISTDAADKGFADRISDFLGGDRARDMVIENAKRANGALTLHDLDQYATGHALDSVMDILYDATRRSNFGDAMRTVAPFGQAWAEIFSSWGKVIARRPETIRRFQLAVEGARGSGFFYTDPTSGQEVFNVPMSGWMMKRIFGVDAPIKMSVSGLNLAGNFLPTLGPVVQIAAGELMRHQPTPDYIRALVLPYGEAASDEDSPTGGLPERVFGGLVPSWMQKAYSALTSSPDSSSVYGNTYSDVLRTLAASGQYGNTSDERARMMADAENKAKALTVIRGIGQFLLPSAPSYQMEADTKQGDVLVNQMAKDLAQWEQEDYNTAIGKFLETYGEGPFIYLQSKTKTVNGGLSASKEFGEWEQSHSRFVSSYPAVAGYFGPYQSDFDFDVYNRQLSSGERKKLSGDEMLQAADATIARWKYNQAKNQMGDKVNTAQRQWLAGYKQALQTQYPGFATYNAGTPDLDVKVAQLRKAAESKQMESNDTAIGVRAYLTLRDAALSEVKTRGGSAGGTNPFAGDKYADLREWLDNGATAIIRQHPDFERVYTNLLSAETAP